MELFWWRRHSPSLAFLRAVASSYKPSPMASDRHHPFLPGCQFAPLCYFAIDYFFFSLYSPT